MDDGSGGGAMQPEGFALCDHCVKAVAVLYCHTDAAKLCLPCDSLVHAANTLSRRHGHSLLCDNCAATTATALCAVDGLILCLDCNWNTHSAIATYSSPSPHPQTPIEAFSNYPSALELTTTWGLDVSAKKIPPFTPLVPMAPTG